MYLARIEVRVEHIERDMAEIKADIRFMRRTIGAGLGLMAIGFGWV